MDSNHFDALARTASSSRRATFATLAAAASGLAVLSTGEAKQKKKGQDCGKKEQQRCNADAETCRSLILAQCELDPAGCQALAACCDACSADGLLRCALELQSTMAAARLLPR
jgi:hypothetical protein